MHIEVGPLSKVCLSTICSLFRFYLLIHSFSFFSRYFASFRLSTVCAYPQISVYFLPEPIFIAMSCQVQVIKR